jgi:hypothetical protein
MRAAIALVILFHLGSATQADDSHPKVRWGAYVDSYYAYDFERPVPPDRAFTTQAVRHNEFNINLAYIEAKLQESEVTKVRGRLALQAGTSVQANYSGEPTQGAFSGPSLSRHVQEAVVGYQVAPEFWIDAGIYFSHVGLESWISADNWTYSRSMVADFSPYYQTGVRASWKPSEQWSAQLHLINGWQNISENNGGKSVGTQILYSAQGWSLSYSTILGNEEGFRHYHDLVLKLPTTGRYQIGLELDYGHQETGSAGSETWTGFTFLQRFAVSEGWAISGRIERFLDPAGVVARSATGMGLRAWGASLGLDRELSPSLLLRGEARGIWAADAVFPESEGYSNRDMVVIASIALKL